MKPANLFFYIYTFFLIILILGCNDSDSNYSINGNFSNLSEEKIYLATAGDYLGYTFKIIDSTGVSNGKFKFNRIVAESEMYYLQTKDFKTIPIFLNNSDIDISGDFRDLANIGIKGSSINEERIKIEKIIDSKENDEDKWIIVRSFINNNNNSRSALSPYLILKYVFNLANYKELSDFYNTLDTELISHHYVQRIKEHLNTLESVEIGEKSPDFTVKDIDGQNINFSSFKGSYVLIDFWASWCGPCRKENPSTVNLYNDLKNEGADFEIIGVAADFTEKRWKDAVVKDKLPWVNVSNIKGLDGEVLKAFGVKSLPYTVLLDKNGVIIEKGLTAEELRDKIRSLF